MASQQKESILSKIQNDFAGVSEDFTGVALKLPTVDMQDLVLATAQFSHKLDKLEARIEAAVERLPNGSAIISWEYESLKSMSDANRVDFEDLTFGIRTKGRNVVFAGFIGKGLKDISWLSQLAYLEVLFLFRNKFADIHPLSELKHLKELRIHVNKLQDITPLSGLTNLTELSIASNRTIDLMHLSTLTYLEQLNLFVKNFKNITALAALTKLKHLTLENPKLDSESRVFLRALAEKGVQVSLYRFRWYNHLLKLFGLGSLVSQEIP